MTSNDTFLPGNHRPVYLWAGSGTIRMNRLKFMGAPVDEAVHYEAHTPVGAERIAVEAGFNWAYLTYDWGFPPEVEQVDWNEFKQAAEVYHAAGVQVFGYIQTSNYAVSGSYAKKDWYALDPAGRPIYYYTGRYMSCWLHPEWNEHLRAMVKGVIDAGADGVFFDNPWHASQPLPLGGAWMGSAGCFCPRCRAAFREASGLEIPKVFPMTKEAEIYIRWRAGMVTKTLAELSALARQLKPGVLISANNFDAVMRPSYLIYGIDLKGLAAVQDVMMIEDYGLPRWQPPTGSSGPILVNNVLTLHTATAVAGSTPVSTDPYDKGIGFDDVYPPRRFQQGIAEAAACGVPMVSKGTEYKVNGQFTLLTASRYGAQRKAIGEYHRFLDGHANLFGGRENAAVIGVLHPGDRLWQKWNENAAAFFGAGQALLVGGIPWRVVTNADQMQGLQFLLTVGPAEIPIPARIKVIDLLTLSGWEVSPPSFLARNAWARSLVSTLVIEMNRSYFRDRWMRRLLDRLGVMHLFVDSPYYKEIPSIEAQKSLFNALGVVDSPKVAAKAPVLVEHWRKGSQEQVHLVNYADSPQKVKVAFGRDVTGKVISPDRDETNFNGSSLELDLDIYAVLLFDQV